LVLINSVLSNMVLYMLSFFLLPKGVLNRLDFFQSRFFWQGDSEKKKYRLAKWSVVCTPKDQGGWEFKTLRSKIQPFLVNGSSDCLENMLALKRCHRFCGNLAIRTSRLD
jgi:hypothetical protein